MENRRLYRSADNRVIGGVAGGLAEYFDIDPVIVRILFVVLSLFGGGGVIIYVLLWIVLPEQRTQRSRYGTFSSADPGAQESNPESSFDMNTEPKSPGDGANDPYRTRGSIIAGVVLITLGSLFLIDNFVPRVNFGDLWPVFLVILGIIILATSMQAGKGNDKRKRS